MLTFYFENVEDLIDFLDTTKEFNEWEATIFRMTATNGMQINIDTRINDTLGYRQFIEFKKLKLMLKNFYTQNSYMNVNMEVKLKFPTALKKSFDPSDYYEAFYVDFYSNDVSTFVTISFLEKTKELQDVPIKAWAVYITNLYNAWLAKKNG